MRLSHLFGSNDQPLFLRRTLLFLFLQRQFGHIEDDLLAFGGLDVERLFTDPSPSFCAIATARGRPLATSQCVPAHTPNNGSFDFSSATTTRSSPKRSFRRLALSVSEWSSSAQIAPQQDQRECPSHLRPVRRRPLSVCSFPAAQPRLLKPCATSSGSPVCFFLPTSFPCDRGADCAREILTFGRPEN